MCTKRRAEHRFSRSRRAATQSSLVTHLTLMYISTRTHHGYQSSLCIILHPSIIHRTRPRSVGYYRRPVAAFVAVADVAAAAEFVF